MSYKTVCVAGGGVLGKLRLPFRQPTAALM